MTPLTTGLAELAGLVVTTFEKGLWTSRISVSAAEAVARISGVRRDPWTFREESLAPIDLSLRAHGALEVSLHDGSRLLWETPTRRVRISRSGQRSSHAWKVPVLRFAPEWLPVNRIILEAFLQESPGDTFDLCALGGSESISYNFVRAEKCTAETDAGKREVWRWAGSRRSYAMMHAQADLEMTAPFDLLLSGEGTLVGWIDPTLDTVTVVNGYEGCSPVALWQREDVAQPVHTTVTLAVRQMIPMSDWVPLAATVMVPGDIDGKALQGPFPTVLLRTPYGRDSALNDAFKFVSRGYAVVRQDVRGRGDSAGFFNAMHEEIGDGNDTLNWIAAQPWSDGNIGMIGASYGGWVQWQAACSGNPHLKALISIVPTFSAFGDLPYVNGMFCAGSLTWSVFVGASAERMHEAMEKDLNALASQLPLIDADIRAVGHEIPFWRYWVTHASMDAYWKKGEILRHQDKIGLPVLHVVGWYDDVLRGTMSAWDMMKANHRPHQQLLVGPWPHVINSVRSLAELSFGPDSCRADMHYGYVRWFDRWLKGIGNGVEAEPPVRYFTMGENKWKSAQRWPPGNGVKHRWYLHPSNAARPERGGRLSVVLPTERPSPDHYVYDPADPTPYLVDIRANQLSVPEDYQEVERRTDVLIYTTDAFDEPFELTGEAAALLYAATDQRDTDWVVRITDVCPDGRSVNLIDGYLRARFRKGMENEALLSPGEILEYRIPMTWTSYRFAAGHRMRLIIASAAAGAFVVNTNTGHPMASDAEIRIAHQSIYHGADYPSHIEIPAPQPRDG